MQDFLMAAHTGWRWVVLALLVLAALAGLAGWAGNRPWSARAGLLAKFLPIAFDVQVALGLLLYGSARMWASSDSFFRTVHPALMIVGLVVLHVAGKRARTLQADRSRYAWLAGGSVAALVLAAAGGALR
jgi:hypothetical protein